MTDATTAGTAAAQLGAGKLMGTGVVYHGIELLGGGAVLAGMQHKEESG